MSLVRSCALPQPQRRRQMTGCARHSAAQLEHASRVVACKDVVEEIGLLRRVARTALATPATWDEFMDSMTRAQARDFIAYMFDRRFGWSERNAHDTPVRVRHAPRVEAERFLESPSNGVPVELSPSDQKRAIIALVDVIIGCVARAVPHAASSAAPCGICAPQSAHRALLSLVAVTAPPARCSTTRSPR